MHINLQGKISMKKLLVALLATVAVSVQAEWVRNPCGSGVAQGVKAQDDLQVACKVADVMRQAWPEAWHGIG